MTVARVLLGLALGALGGPDEINRLVDRLGSPKFAEREAAAQALQRMGPEAIPALRSAGSSADLEIRTRSAAILRQVEGTLLTRATLVWLRFDDVPLPDVIHALRERTGMNLALVPERLPRWALQKVTLSEPQPLPFWQAMDRLCAAAGLHGDLELGGALAHEEGSLGLTARANRPVRPASDHGPFRVCLVDLDYHRKLDFAAAPARPEEDRGGQQQTRPELGMETPPAHRVQFTARLQVLAEPRLGIGAAGPLCLREASDDRGGSLLLPTAEPPRLSAETAYLGSACSPSLNLEVRLKPPETPARMIRVLRGTIPLKVTARQPDPLVIPLAHAAGRSFHRGDLHVTVHEVRSDPDTRQRQIELSVRQDRPDPVEGEVGGDDGPPGEPGSLVDPLPRQLDVRDDRGQTLRWFQTGVDLESARVTLTLAGPSAGEPREIRYYRLSELTVYVPFTFRDVPMP